MCGAREWKDLGDVGKGEKGGSRYGRRDNGGTNGRRADERWEGRWSVVRCESSMSFSSRGRGKWRRRVVSSSELRGEGRILIGVVRGFVSLGGKSGG